MRAIALRKTSLALIGIAMTVPMYAQAASKFMADAAFEGADGCVSTETFVFVRLGSNSSNGGAKALIFINQVDDCQGTEVLTARGKANLGPSELQFDQALGSVTLNARIKMIDEVSRRPLNVDARITWLASEEPVTASITDDLEEPGKFTKRGQRFQKTLRLAEASGNLSDGKGNFAPGPARDASISVSRY